MKNTRKTTLRLGLISPLLLIILLSFSVPLCQFLIPNMQYDYLFIAAYPDWGEALSDRGWNNPDSDDLKTRTNLYDIYPRHLYRYHAATKTIERLDHIEAPSYYELLSIQDNASTDTNQINFHGYRLDISEHAPDDYQIERVDTRYHDGFFGPDRMAEPPHQSLPAASCYCKIQRLPASFWPYPHMEGGRFSFLGWVIAAPQNNEEPPE